MIISSYLAAINFPVPKHNSFRFNSRASGYPLISLHFPWLIDLDLDKICVLTAQLIFTVLEKVILGLMRI